MALEVTAEMSFSRTKVIMTDTSGDYNASTNPGGYGAPNAAFADFAHHWIIRKKNVNEVADEVLTLDEYDEITDTEVSADRAVDGWYEGIKLNITLWTAGTYASGTVRQHNGVVYLSNTSTSQTPGVGSEWDAVTDLTTIEDNATLTATIVGRVTAYNGDLYWSKQIATNSEQGQCGICRDDRKKTRLDNIKFHIDCVLVADQLGDNTNGEWNALALIQLGAYISE